MKHHLITTSIVLGIGMVLLGALWERINPPASYWPESKAREYVEAYTEFHAAQDHVSHGHAHGGPAVGRKAFDAARERFESLSGELDAARAARSRTGKYLAVTGLFVLLSAILARNIAKH